MRVLITGANGFTGSHMAELCLKKGAQVFGTVRSWRSNLENLTGIQDRLHLIECDLRDLTSTVKMLETTRPDWIIHLAAKSYVASSWNTPTETLNNNLMCQLNLFEGILGVGIHPRFLVVGSSEEYGQVNKDELPILETNQLRPLSPYAVSKVGQDMMGYQYWRSYGLNIVRARAFNHEGPRRGEVFVTSNFAKQIAEIEAGHRSKVVYVGNLSTIRDYTDVRDVVRAYWDLLSEGAIGEVYNICSGKGWLIEEVLRTLLSFTGAIRAEIEVAVDQDRMRPSDVPVLVGSAEKIFKLSGWKPEIQFEETLLDTLNYWRSRV